MNRNLKESDPVNCPMCGAELIRHLDVLDCTECAYQVDDSRCRQKYEEKEEIVN